MPDARGTPVAWRLAAGVTLAGGLWLGFVATGGRAARLAVLAAAATGLGSAIPIARASRRPPIAPRRTSGGAARSAARSGPTFTVVVACRDEATVLPRLIADLAGQDHRSAAGRPLLELVVIDDRSTDGTADAAARAAGAAGLETVLRLVRRTGSDLPDGKGAALTALAPSAYRGDVVVVLDADARIGPSFLSTLAHYVAAGADAITARRRILEPRSSWLAGAQTDEQTVDGELQRGRWALGGLSEFRGNGIVVRRDLLIEVGGWRSEALTEDLDLSSRIAAARGHGVAWALDAEVWEEPVHDWRSLWRQRTRWAEGAIRRWLEHGPAVLRSARPTPRAKLDFATYGGQLLAPPLLGGALAGAVVRRRWGTAALLVGGYAAAGAGLAWDALRWETAADGGPLRARERSGRALRAALFGGVWLAAVPAALWRLATRRGSVVYDKMTHSGSGSPAWEGSHR